MTKVHGCVPCTFVTLPWPQLKTLLFLLLQMLSHLCE